MLTTFLSSLLLGAALTAALLASREALRRALSHRPRPLGPGEGLRCVRPLDRRAP